MMSDSLQGGWISPEGIFHPCDRYGHTRTAEELCTSLPVPSSLHLRLDARLHLESLGWLHASVLGSRFVVHYGPDEAQAEVLMAWTESGICVDRPNSVSGRRT